MSLVVSFCAVFLPRDVLDEIVDLVESVSEGFPTFSSLQFIEIDIVSHHKIQVATSLVAKVFLMRYYIEKPIRNVSIIKCLKKLSKFMISIPLL